MKLLKRLESKVTKCLGIFLECIGGHFKDWRISRCPHKSQQGRLRIRSNACQPLSSKSGSQIASACNRTSHCSLCGQHPVADARRFVTCGIPELYRVK